MMLLLENVCREVGTIKGDGYTQALPAVCMPTTHRWWGHKNTWSIFHYLIFDILILFKKVYVLVHVFKKTNSFGKNL